MPITPIQCQFLPDGAVLAPDNLDDRAFYIGVGGIDHPRVFDHHQPGLPPGTTPAALVWAKRSALADLGAPLEGLPLVCHRHPHWNSCWAATLLLELLAGAELDPARVDALNRYAALVLIGHNPVEGVLERSPLAVFEGLMAGIEESTRNDPDLRDQRKLLEGIDFFRTLYARITDDASLKHADFGNDPGPYTTVLPRLRADHQAYLHDLHEGRRFVATITHGRGIQHRVDGLQLRQPVARLFKFWARGDREHSPGRAGFPLLWVQWSTTRWVISVDPASGYNLEGLGDRLTAAETRRHPPPPGVPPRPGYKVPDPWFDGRGTAFPFTIVDSPKQGTRLSRRQLERQLRAFFRVRQWRPAFTRPSPWRDRWLPLFLPVTASLAVSGLALWYGMQPAPGVCPQWREPPPLEVSDGRHFVIAIGIADYQAPQWPTLGNPVADARAVLEQLIKHYGFEPLDAGSKLLVSDDAEVVTEQRIKAAIQSLATDERRLTDQDTLIIYYAGHGAMDPSFGYWIPQDAQDSADYVEHTWLRQVLRDSPARHILVLSDACFSGKLAGDDAAAPVSDGTPPQAQETGTKDGWLSSILSRSPVPLFTDTAPPAALPDANLRALVHLPSRQFITSGHLEQVPDGSGEHSPFAACLLQLLEDDTRPWLSGYALFQSLHACAQRGDQVPEPKRMRAPAACDGQGDLVLRRQPQEPEH